MARQDMSLGSLPFQGVMQCFKNPGIDCPVVFIGERFKKSVAPPRIRRQSWANPFEAALSIYIVNLRQLRGHNLFRQIWQFNRQIGGKRNSVSFRLG